MDILMSYRSKKRCLSLRTCALKIAVLCVKLN